jgi:hypothetical protein
VKRGELNEEAGLKFRLFYWHFQKKSLSVVRFLKCLRLFRHKTKNKI